MAKDLYTILGVSKNASKDEIKQAYRKLSKELHPDKHKGDASKEGAYKEINEAYEVLGNDEKRKRYDQFGSANGPQFGGGGGGQGFGGFDFGGNQGNMGGFSDIFESFFGGQAQSGQQKAARGRDIEVELTIEFTDSVAGAQKKIRLNRLRSCATCSGTGAAEGSSLTTCTTCSGTGQITRTAQSFFGAVQQTSICNSCRGSGKVPENPCHTCNGEGRQQITEEVPIDVPAGISDGQALRVQGAGEAGRQGTQAGDLYVHIRVKQDARFEREGDDVRSTETISVLDALLGTELSVTTVLGKVTLKVPEGTQPNQVFRLKDKGMPVLNTSRHGDHYVTITVEVPKKLSRRERNLLEEWRGLQ